MGHIASNAPRSLHALLHLPTSASHDDVVSTYRTLLKQLHPDASRKQDSFVAELQAAYEAYKRRHARASIDSMPVLRRQAL